MTQQADIDRTLDDAMAACARSVDGRIELHRRWLPEPDTVTLEPHYAIERHGGRARVKVRLGVHELYLDEPVPLAPVDVPKPWGREIWLTGIEARGESRVRTAGGELPLSEYLALAPRRLSRARTPVLLKVLDPRPEPVLGDLYFEVHEEKQEVYVVSHVDRDAWPDGRGAIRFGMNQRLRAEYRDDDRFRRDYLAAVKAYERVRRAIDAGEPVPARREQELRTAMEAFTELRELAVGDVVVVPTWLPHSLQHGVRVVEFQTPTYERHILSFAQQVVTQDHWDTESAVPRMRLDAPAPPSFERVAPGVERICTFDDFRVHRLTLAPGAAAELPAGPSYLVCMAVGATVTLGSLTLAPEQAAFVPAAALEDPGPGRRTRLTNPSSDIAVVLMAAPDL